MSNKLFIFVEVFLSIYFLTQIFSVMKLKFLFFLILTVNFSYSQESSFSMDIKDIAFRTIATSHAQWTEYKKQKFHKSFFNFLDSAITKISIRVPLKNYSYDERKKVTTITTYPVDFYFDVKGNNSMKIRLNIAPIKIEGDEILTQLVVVPKESTYIEILGTIDNFKLGEVQISEKEKRKLLTITMINVSVEQSKDKSKEIYKWKTEKNILETIGDVLEKKYFSESFNLETFGYKKMNK